jgi:hypothetical protein
MGALFPRGSLKIVIPAKSNGILENFAVENHLIWANLPALGRRPAEKLFRFPSFFLSALTNSR